jgi:DNA-binding NtrC family response regulator
VTIDTPPLRDRGDDVETLAEACLERIAARLGRRTPRLSADARAALHAHRWPGNVRELENALERALVLSTGDTLTAADLPRPAPPVAAGVPSPAGELLTVAEAEKRAILAALRTRRAAGRGRRPPRHLLADAQPQAPRLRRSGTTGRSLVSASTAKQRRRRFGVDSETRGDLFRSTAEQRVVDVCLLSTER